jgi:dolichyl-phosphate-mannose-protein mannosyltransferase
MSPDLSPRSSSDFEEVPYPPSHWASSRQEEELPLHYINEDKARRRVAKGSGVAGFDTIESGYGQEYDDECIAKQNPA